MNIRPLQDRIIVERVEEETTTAGGIIIPDTVSKEKPQEGKVIAAGKGKVTPEGKVLPLDVKEGDLVLFGKYAGSEIKIDGVEYLIMREDDILGVVEQAGSAFASCPCCCAAQMLTQHQAMLRFCAARALTETKIETADAWYLNKQRITQKINGFTKTKYDG